MVRDLYAIRHVHTGRYMPVAGRRRATIVELDEFTVVRNIRWFDTHEGAARALRAWCKGVWSKRHGEFSPITNEYEVYGGEPPSEAPADRKIEEFEIVPFIATDGRSVKTRDTAYERLKALLPFIAEQLAEYPGVVWFGDDLVASEEDIAREMCEALQRVKERKTHG